MSPAPDILVFLTDDHARWALSSYGGTAFPAPAIEGLAAQGVVMDQAYSVCPVCSPARASFLTGLMPSQHGVRDFIGAQPEFHRRDWLAGISTLPEQLATAGYRCGLSGKWHVGRDDAVARGFDFWNAMSGAYPVSHVGDQEMSRGGVVGRRAGYLTEAITEGALEFLADASDERPRFLMVGYYATHSPWQGQPDALLEAARGDPWTVPVGAACPPGFRVTNPEAPPPGQEAEAVLNYRAAVADIDRGIARILASLDGRDTLIVYTADHGLALGQGGLWGKGNATVPPNLFDTSVRLPMILSRPGYLPQGVRDDRFIDHCDLYSLIRAAAGIDTPEADGLRRPGTVPGTPKPVQVCEYGTAARLLSNGDSHEYRPGAPPPARSRETLEAFYAALDCIPPWEWTPHPSPQFNLVEAWSHRT